MPSLRELGLGGDAMSDPLGYPGAVPDRPGLLTGEDVLWMRLPEGAGIDDARVAVAQSGQEVPLPLVLLMLGAEPVDNRHPVVAVGSNASPGQLVRKFRSRGVSCTVPLSPAVIDGIAIGHSAHVSRWGYIAATPVTMPQASRTPIGVLWLDAAQRRALDLTEPNYSLNDMDGEVFRVTLPSGGRLGRYSIYTSKWGALLGTDGRPYLRQPQERLLADLLARSDELAELLGPDPASFVATAATDEAARDAARALFRRLGWVAQEA